MSRLDALKNLAEKVEAGVKYKTMGHTRLCQKAFPSDHPKTREGYANAPAQLACNVWNNDSLDAAKALHGAVLPGWHFNVSTEANGNGFYADISDPKWSEVYTTCKGIPAHAWLICILRALIAQAESK